MREENWWTTKIVQVYNRKCIPTEEEAQIAFVNLIYDIFTKDCASENRLFDSDSISISPEICCRPMRVEENASTLIPSGSEIQTDVGKSSANMTENGPVRMRKQTTGSYLLDIRNKNSEMFQSTGSSDSNSTQSSGTVSASTDTSNATTISPDAESGPSKPINVKFRNQPLKRPTRLLFDDSASAFLLKPPQSSLVDGFLNFVKIRTEQCFGRRFHMEKELSFLGFDSSIVLDSFRGYGNLFSFREGDRLHNTKYRSLKNFVFIMFQLRVDIASSVREALQSSCEERMRKRVGVTVLPGPNDF